MKKEGPQEQPIAVRSKDVSLEMLVSALFYNPDEGNQRDTFQMLLRYYGTRDKDWTLGKFAQWLSDARRKPQGREVKRKGRQMSYQNLRKFMKRKAGANQAI